MLPDDDIRLLQLKCAAVHRYILESNVLDNPCIIIPLNMRRIHAGTVKVNVPEDDLLDPLARSRVIFLILQYPQIEQFTKLKRFNPDILIRYIADCIVVACVNRQAAPVIGLWLMMLQDIKLREPDILNHITVSVIITVCADIDRVGDIRPQDGAADRDIPCIAPEFAARCIHRNTVIRCAEETSFNGDLFAGHHINAVTPAARTERFQVADQDMLRLAEKYGVVWRINYGYPFDVDMT